MPEHPTKALLERLGYIPAEDFADMLGVSLRTLKNRPRSKLPTYVKAGRRWLFEEQSVREYLAARRVKDEAAVD